MSRTWAELLGDSATADEAEESGGFFSRLRDSLGKSRRALTEQLALTAFDPSEEQAWERAGGAVGNRGGEAAEAALAMAEWIEDVRRHGAGGRPAHRVEAPRAEPRPRARGPR